MTMYLYRRQYVEVIQARTKTAAYVDKISHVFDNDAQITGDNVKFQKNGMHRIAGKVRDRYDLDQYLALVTTDRQSGFDRMLAKVPYKGQVLNLTSAYWFEQTKDIIPNHILSVPHPNVSIVKKCKPFPIEFVVRAFMTGSTSTSIWKNYCNGVRDYCGHRLPDGMVKNQKLSKILLTPTTKEEDHDRPISELEIVQEGWMTREDLDVCAKAALAVFEMGQEIAAKRGLILVDTKYEFGKDEHGNILLIDEVHTPDSSRYWIASSYEERMKAGEEPENIDKEFLRLWFAKHCDPYKDKVLPDAPKELVCELSRRYISLYEMITGKVFEFDNQGAEEKIGLAIEGASNFVASS
jgi:phosphoribosylaminoimidazole-succinocarboxamide synthase